MNDYRLLFLIDSPRSLRWNARGKKFRIINVNFFVETRSPSVAQTVLELTMLTM